MNHKRANINEKSDVNLLYKIKFQVMISIHLNMLQSNSFTTAPATTLHITPPPSPILRFPQQPPPLPARGTILNVS
jgi:hypothetical protein